MEFNRFSDFENAVRSRQSELAETRTRVDQEKQERAEKERNLEIARERMRQKCRDAADFLKSRSIPTYKRSTTEWGGGKFPEGWAVTKDTADCVTAMLTVEGEWLMVVTNKSALGKIGDIVEYPYDRYDSYGVDDNGPYLTYNVDSYGEYPPASLEDDFSRMIAKVITG